MCTKFEIPVELSGRTLCSTTRDVYGTYHASLFNCSCSTNALISPTVTNESACISESIATKVLFNLFIFTMGCVFAIVSHLIYRCGKHGYTEYTNYQRYKRRQNDQLIDVEDNQSQQEKTPENIIL
ncbi:hypothetical protein GCK72_026263 [Caenorhabditis remanei]|uniref:Uncharacterized protein n=1 Tax=Caenorhabditis remanei TaxID=31234 RepID=A0A6A5G5C3_CAERE|nr:hypothetical protein GCK72_026263 [Caenorhabditis remanei]KAF1749794.1 hypothetical protein GCK72_026263 [Caenorhabditis remanei]